MIPAGLLAPDQNCVAPNGNAHLKAEHTTEYELGYGRQLDADSTIDLTLYRTNLHSPIENFYPLGTTCPPTGSSAVAQSLPVNVGNAIYQGGALAFLHRFGHVLARLDYAINQAYPTSIPAEFVANPTSGSSLVPNQQFAGISPRSGALDVLYKHSNGSHLDVFALYCGTKTMIFTEVRTCRLERQSGARAKTVWTSRSPGETLRARRAGGLR